MCVNPSSGPETNARNLIRLEHVVLRWGLLNVEADTVVLLPPSRVGVDCHPVTVRLWWGAQLQQNTDNAVIMTRGKSKRKRKTYV